MGCTCSTQSKGGWFHLVSSGRDQQVDKNDKRRPSYVLETVKHVLAKRKTARAGSSSACLSVIVTSCALHNSSIRRKTLTKVASQQRVLPKTSARTKYSSRKTALLEKNKTKTKWGRGKHGHFLLKQAGWKKSARGGIEFSSHSCSSC